MRSYSFNLKSTDKILPSFTLAFLLLHGLLFLGVEYIIFQDFPIFTLIHAILGIGIYLIFWRASFPRLFRDVLIAAAISTISGILFGDIILDNYFFAYQKTPIGFIAQAYSGLVVFYIYFYLALIKKVYQNA